jgi:8-oxo-dGTP pyrophosphatase MutT (NUDIX family)
VPASTLVLLRDRPGGGAETLLIQRHQASRFAAGDFVFPGGKVEAADVPEDITRWCRGLEAAEAAHRLGLAGDPRAALGYWTGAIREAFEEVGLLLARDAQDRPVNASAPRFADYRRACQRDHRTFWDMLKAEGLTLALDELVYFAHWITPEERPLRYDTRFFAAPAPSEQEAIADEHEIVAVRWLTPAAALQAHQGGQLPLRLPTARNLALFAEATSTADALRRLDGIRVAMIRPRLVTDGGQPRTILPGEPGYY